MSKLFRVKVTEEDTGKRSSLKYVNYYVVGKNFRDAEMKALAEKYKEEETKKDILDEDNSLRKDIEPVTYEATDIELICNNLIGV